MAKQWLRACKLTIGTQDGKNEALDFSQFRIVFWVRQAVTSTPRHADIRIYNVSAATRAKFVGEGQEIILEAGYLENSGVIFRGRVAQLVHRRESQTDTYLHVLATVADQADCYAVVNQSLAAGSTADDRRKAIMSALKPFGIDQGFTTELPEARLPRGKVMYGMGRDFMTDLAKTHQCNWNYTNDNKIDILPIGASKDKSDEAIVINRNTGMIGMPQLTNGGIYVDCALNPQLDWGRLIKLDNASIQRPLYNPSYDAAAQNLFISEQTFDSDGIYKIIALDHRGDTRGQEWASSLVCKGLNATVQPISGAAINSVQS